MTMQILATPLYAVPEVRTDIGVLQVLGFNEEGDAYCIQLGQLNGVRPTRPGVWDQERHGRLSFYSSTTEARDGLSKAARQMERRAQSLDVEAAAILESAR